ncbi:MAG: glucose 1-dehydrogenase [Henriciella sp.]
MRLNGKVAIITGAAKGLGEADARLFAKEGASVILTDMDTENGERIAAEIGESAEFHQQDVSDEESWKTLIDQVVHRHGKLDILVNNAGIVHPGTIETQTTEHYRAIMAVSADATFFGCKYAIEAMKQHDGQSSIINMASVAAISGEANVLGYCGAKGAVEAMTRAVAVHCARSDYKIRCNAILPGMILTPMVQNIQVKMTDNTEVNYTPDRYAPVKMGEPNDIAQTALFLASDESKHLNGASIRVDYGATVTPR